MEYDVSFIMVSLLLLLLLLLLLGHFTVNVGKHVVQRKTIFNSIRVELTCYTVC